MSDHPRSRNVQAPVEALKLMGDLCLVKPAPLEKEGSIVIPESARSPKGQMLQGVVVATGPGDRLIYLHCRECSDGVLQPIAARLPRECRNCGQNPAVWRVVGEPLTECQKPVFRRKMGVKVGDRVLYWRSPANEVMVDGERYEILHEEQMIVAVIED